MQYTYFAQHLFQHLFSGNKLPSLETEATKSGFSSQPLDFHPLHLYPRRQNGKLMALAWHCNALVSKLNNDILETWEPMSRNSGFKINLWSVNDGAAGIFEKNIYSGNPQWISSWFLDYTFFKKFQRYILCPIRFLTELYNCQAEQKVIHYRQIWLQKTKSKKPTS